MTLTPRFAPDDPATIEDPYRVYAALRASGRTARGGPGQIVVPGYHDVQALLRSSSLCNEFPPEYRTFTMGRGPAADFLSRVVLHRDPPAHRELRRFLGAPLLKAQLPQLAERARSLACTLWDDALSRPAFDAVQALAQPLPVMMICEILGVPAEHSPTVRPHAAALGRAFKLNATAQDRELTDASLTFLRDYMRAALDEGPEGASGAGLLAAAIRGGQGLDPADVLDNLIFLFFAGFETTTSLIGTALGELSLRPELFQRLQSQPDLMPLFIEECLRYEAPIQSRARLVREPVEIGDKVLRPSRIAVLLIGSANRDPAVFDRPDEFDVDRTPNPHLSFGAGAHFCLGFQLAKIETEAVLRELIERRRTITPLTPPQYDPESVFRCYRTLPLRHEPA
jgi:cytochrome P450